MLPHTPPPDAMPPVMQFPAMQPWPSVVLKAPHKIRYSRMNQRPIPTHVLVVDDEADIREMARRWLEASPGAPDDGWRVTEADGVESACAALVAQSFDCILLDLGMGPLTPRAVFDTVRRCAGNTPILIFSNSDEDELYDYCLQHGAVNFLPKLGVHGADLITEICAAMHWVESERCYSRLVANANNYMEVRHKYDAPEMTGDTTNGDTVRGDTAKSGTDAHGAGSGC